MINEVIRVGDTTTHGGVVQEGFPGTNIHGRQIAGIGHRVLCPKCEGVVTIAQGNPRYTVNGTPVAQQGMRTTCGATLIAQTRVARPQ